MAEGSQSIFLVEDNPADEALIRAHLEEFGGFEVHSVESFRTAMARLGEISPDLVLLDLQLPDAAGLLGLERLQSSFPEIAVVVLTGFATDDIAIAREAMKLGAQDYLYKGAIDAYHLERSLYLAIERKKLEQYRMRWAREDPSTGLPRFQVLEDRFERATSRASRGKTWLTFLQIAIDGYAQLAQEVGHGAAEEHVKIVASRLSRVCRKSDTLVRLDGSRFALLAEGVRYASDGHSVARKMLSAMRKPVEHDGHSAALTLSIGMDCIAPDEHLPALTRIMETTERALAQAQQSGGNGHVAVENELVV